MEFTVKEVTVSGVATFFNKVHRQIYIFLEIFELFNIITVQI